VKRALYLLPLALFIALVGYFMIGLQRDPRKLPSALLDRPAPDFSLPPLVEGKPGIARADLLGEVGGGGPILVNFFASWCGPCRTEHPLLMKLAQEGVPLTGVAYKDKPEDARAWLQQLGDPYKRIGQDRSGRTAIEFGVYGVPETYVIDRTGTIRYRHVGPVMPADLETKIRPLLAELKR
jgi:cytochrome c biogenesis protein CcmG/thiol:disulfide interchange protein DsbE